ncbi:MAG TPA: class I SAM-dependent methyltransferase [Candidatus Acidoferrales bacterium]|nr:class I SAM-dependent methyltransferase [Candidatus Acidoferrales bacterium]
MTAAHTNYALGRTQQEYARLARQSALLEPMTRRTFTDAGIAPGMRVLDLGSGAGDICMLLAEMVGTSGSVTGLDLDPNALAHARERVSAAGLRNVSFAQCEFSAYAPEKPFDALVGRFVLMYQPDPAAALAAAAKHLKPGGAIAFLEPWFMPVPPREDVLSRVGSCIVETLRRSGAHLDLGPRLHKAFMSAGLPLPRMRFEMLMDGAPDSPIYQYMADTYASILPKAIEFGVPTAEGLASIEEIPRRVAADVQAMGVAAFAAPLVSAWCKT